MKQKRKTNGIVGRGRVIALGSEETPTGFRRFAAHPNAAAAEEVSRWLAVKCELVDQVKNPRPINGRAQEALRLVDELALALRWQRSREDLQGYTDPAIAYFLALDQRSPTARLRGMVARAYAEAERLVNAYADYLADAPQLDHDISELIKILPRLESMLPDRAENLPAGGGSTLRRVTLL